MPATRSYHNYHDVFSPSKVIEPTGKQQSTDEAGTSANLTGVSKRLADAVAMIRQKVGMALLNVPLALVGELNLGLEKRARERTH
ncbi:MAG TPA: hypothetical protein VFE56_06585 [Candidatus Binataceae bacterium]|jgi:hypothetical protein|nr:hypothetical protein [Candidatus Binataceae bacterium]